MRFRLEPSPLCRATLGICAVGPRVIIDHTEFLSFLASTPDRQLQILHRI